MDPRVWTRPAPDLHRPRRDLVAIEHGLWLALGLVIGFVAGLVTVG